MDDVERMYRHLVRTIRATSPQLLTQPFQVSDLYSTILPYRLHRRELGLETNQDYEMAMLELLVGRARLSASWRTGCEQALGDSLKSPNPDPALIREFASSRVRSRRTRCASSMATDGRATAAPTSADAATIATAPAGTPIKEARDRARAPAGPAATAPTTQVPVAARDTGARDRRTSGRHDGIGAGRGDAPPVASDHRLRRRRGVPALQGRASRRPADQLLSALRPGSDGAPLPRVRERTGARVEVLRHLRTGGGRRVTTASRTRLSDLGAWLAR